MKRQMTMFDDYSAGGDLLQVAPGKYVMKGGKPPEQVIADVFRHADGTLGVRPMPGGRYVRVTKRSARSLGFPSIQTLRRLGTAGFVEVSKPAPGVLLVNLDSWLAHLRDTQEDPDFWDAGGENWKTYMFKNGMRTDK